MRDKYYTSFGKVNEKREYGIGFAVKNDKLDVVEPPTNSSDRILTMRLNITTGPVTFISEYVPTLMATAEVKDEFYEKPFCHHP